MADPMMTPPTQLDNSLIVEPPPETTPTPSPDPDPAPSSTPDSTPPVSDYERRLREENAEYRKRWSRYEELFDGFEDDEDRAAVEQLVALAKSGDPEARTQVAQVFGLQLPPEESPTYMTPAEVQRMLDERDAKRDEQAAIDSVYQQAESLGYSRNSEEMVRLLWHVNQMDEPDIKAADAIIKGERQRYIDEYLKEKASQADGSITQPTSPTSTPNTQAPPKTWGEAANRAQERMRAGRQ